MSIRSYDATVPVRRDQARMRTGAIRLVWVACLGACLLFWWVVLAALLG